MLILAVAGEFLLRPDKALENDGTVIASVAEDGATAVAIPQPAEPETVRDALAKAVGLSREQVAGEASSAGRRSLLDKPGDLAGLLTNLNPGDGGSEKSPDGR